MRADKFFAEKFGSRTKAAEELSAGRILRGNKPLAPKDEVQEGDIFTFISPEKRFVSNGGYKLEKAISAFGYDCRGKIFADIGASTGGFTDCLLQNGAQKVFAVDVGESLLDSKIAADPRVIPMEIINARYLYIFAPDSSRDRGFAERRKRRFRADQAAIRVRKQGDRKKRHSKKDRT